MSLKRSWWRCECRRNWTKIRLSTRKSSSLIPIHQRLIVLIKFAKLEWEGQGLASPNRIVAETFQPFVTIGQNSSQSTCHNIWDHNFRALVRLRCANGYVQNSSFAACVRFPQSWPACRVDSFQELNSSRGSTFDWRRDYLFFTFLGLVDPFFFSHFFLLNKLRDVGSSPIVHNSFPVHIEPSQEHFFNAGFRCQGIGR